MPIDMRDAQEIGTLLFEMHGEPATYLRTNITEFGKVYITFFCRGCFVNVRSEEIHKYIVRPTVVEGRLDHQPGLQLHL